MGENPKSLRNRRRSCAGLDLIDTCCIDKSSSAELSEAIKSMFRWYRDAYICIVYLSDVDSSPADLLNSSNGTADVFRKSRWFTRGWTLQELLAPDPRKIYFYNRHWHGLGARKLWGRLVAEAAMIPVGAGGFNKHGFSVAQRLSWVARRETSRLEDIVYCLFGLFDIHMPLLYGEGETAAFLRLQRELISQSDDESIFAWQADDGFTTGSALALTPRWFKASSDIKPIVRNERPAYAITNKGLEIQANLWQPAK